MSFKPNLRTAPGVNTTAFTNHRIELYKKGKNEGWRRLVHTDNRFYADYQIKLHTQGYSYSMNVLCFQHGWLSGDDYDYITRNECLQTVWAHIIYDLESELKSIKKYDKSDWRISKVDNLIESIIDKQTLFGIDEPEVYGMSFTHLPFN